MESARLKLFTFEVTMKTLQNHFHSSQEDALEENDSSIRTLNESHTSFWKMNITIFIIMSYLIDECFLVPVALD